MEDSKRPKIKFNGRDYDVVSAVDWTMDECMVLWDYARIGVDTLEDIEGFNPGVTMALIHVSVARAEPDVPAREIKRLIGAMQWVKLQEVFASVSEEVDDESVPPPKEPEGEPQIGSNGNASGPDSSITGDVPLAAVPPPPSGPLGSAIGATSGRETSAA